MNIPESIEKIIINSVLNPAFIVKRILRIPPVDIAEGVNLKMIEYLINDFKELIPTSLEDTDILIKPIPDYEKYFLHFVREHRVNSRKYIYIFKIDLQYGGGGKPIADVKDPHGFMPGCETNKIFYHSMLIPVEKIDHKDKRIVSFTPRVYTEAQKQITTSSKKYIVSELFDQQDFSDISKKLTDTFYPEEGSFDPVADYYPVKFEYSTLALNLLYADKAMIDRILPAFDKMVRIVLDGESEEILTEEDYKMIRSFYSLYQFERKVNENRDVYWDVTISSL
ncbi:MAG: hypothetical protein KKH98_08390 [Spirochaetes bacterium]|nr:hypothetical protein [Spirochaetota bacterium]